MNCLLLMFMVTGWCPRELPISLVHKNSDQYVIIAKFMNQLFNHQIFDRSLELIARHVRKEQIL